MDNPLPVGKLPPALLQRLIDQVRELGVGADQDQRVRVGPGLGFDCAIVEAGDQLLALKADPITFASAEIGWYAVHVNANDLATCGSKPAWFLATLLLPEKKTTPELVEEILAQVAAACREVGAVLVGGHTEITHDLERPLLAGTLVGVVDRDELVTPAGAQVGDHLLLTKGVPIEATAILARELGEHLEDILSPQELEQAQNYLYDPGISVLKEARLAQQAGCVHAMHDPTEGGLYCAVWELAQASGLSFIVDSGRVYVPEVSAKICRTLELDPLACIASGALLLCVSADEAETICQAIQAGGIACMEIGQVYPDPPGAWLIDETGSQRQMPYPERDGIAHLFSDG